MNTIAKCVVALALLSLPATEAGAQLIVSVRPPRPAVIVTRPVAPSPRHVWVEEDWVCRGRGYRWHGGYWAAPPRPRAVWVPGHWDTRPRGEVWVPGFWR